MSCVRKPRVPKCRFAGFGWCAEADGPLAADARDESSQASVMARYRGRGPTTYSHESCGPDINGVAIVVPAAAAEPSADPTNPV